mmetsp:Transcript_90269/g.162778  ORF Transcript_90269/g.162778 Transcript_90269/m.162778 type:complete len:254 (-) Transcript_90269:339-1100(-)
MRPVLDLLEATGGRVHRPCRQVHGDLCQTAELQNLQGSACPHQRRVRLEGARDPGGEHEVGPKKLLKRQHTVRKAGEGAAPRDLLRECSATHKGSSRHRLQDANKREEGVEVTISFVSDSQSVACGDTSSNSQSSCVADCPGQAQPWHVAVEVQQHEECRNLQSNVQAAAKRAIQVVDFLRTHRQQRHLANRREAEEGGSLAGKCRASKGASTARGRGEEQDSQRGLKSEQSVCCTQHRPLALDLAPERLVLR